jgi:integrase
MALAINAAMARGDNPAAALRDSRAELTLGELFQEYLERYAIPQGKKTIGEMRSNVLRYLTTLTPKPLSQISHIDLQKLVNSIGKERGHATANRVVELVRAVYNKGTAWRLFAGQNPAVGIAKFRIKARDRFVQGDELPRLFRVLAETENVTSRDFVLLLLLTGARRANVLAMRWDAMHFDRAEWSIPETKNGTPQTVTLTGEALTILKSRRENGSPWVFPGTGKSGHMVSPKNGWKALLDQDELNQLTELIERADGVLDFTHPPERSLTQRKLSVWSLARKLATARQEAKRLGIDTSTARLNDLRIHDLRRTMGSWQAKTGASLVIIGKSLNHKSIATTQIYARLDSDPVRESMERATAAMFKAAGIEPTTSKLPAAE